MTQTLERTIAQGTLWASGSTILLKGLAVVNTLLVLSHLTVYQYGVAELALSVIGLMAIFMLPGLDKTVMTDIGVLKGEGNVSGARTLFDDYLLLQALLGVLAFAVLFLGSHQIAHFYTDEIGEYFKIIALLFLLSPLGVSLRILLNVQFDFAGQAVFSLLQEIFKFVLLGTFMLTAEFTIQGLLWSLVLSQALALLALSPRAYRAYGYFAHAKRTTPFDPVQFVKTHGKWTIFANYLDSFGKTARLWIIKFFLGTEAVALFAVAQGLFGHVASLLQINQVVAPILPQYLAEKDRFYRIIQKTIKYQLIGAGALIVVSVLFMPLFIEILFPKYLPALPVFFIMLSALLPASITGVFQTMFFTIKAQRNLFFALAVKLCMVVLFTPLALLAFGTYGIGVEFIITTILFSLERYRVLRKLLPDFKVHVSDMLRFDEYDRMLLKNVRNRIPFSSSP